MRTRDAGLLPRRQGEAGVLALWWVLAVVVLKCALTFAVADRYGWHIDELYYAVAGRHLQGGYVEFPPVTALLAALARVLFGWLLVGLRALTILAGAGTALVGVLVARELGASRRAQKLVAIVVAFCPGMLATNWLFQPVAFDQLTTMIVLWLAVRLARGRGSWPLLGLAAGIGLETKYTLAVVLVLLVATFLGWRRDVLSAAGLTAAVAIAVVLLVPNLVWEAGHGWTSVHFFLNPPPDWPPNIRLTGTFAWDTPRSLPAPPELDAFLDDGPPPVLVTLGGSSAVDPHDFYPNAVAAVRGLDRRALVLTGPTPQPVVLDPDPQLFSCRFAPLSRVAPRCTAAVHHGGIGTTVAMLTAGLPQLIVPRGFDQPQTALRMERLGVAHTVPWKRATAARLTRGLRRTLAEPRYRDRARQLAEQLRDEDGLRGAAEAIEELLPS